MSEATPTPYEQEKPFWLSATKLVLLLFALTLCFCAVYALMFLGLDIFQIVFTVVGTSLGTVLGFYFGKTAK